MPRFTVVTFSLPLDSPCDMIPWDQKRWQIHFHVLREHNTAMKAFWLALNSSSTFLLMCYLIGIWCTLLTFLEEIIFIFTIREFPEPLKIIILIILIIKKQWTNDDVYKPCNIILYIMLQCILHLIWHLQPECHIKWETATNCHCVSGAPCHTAVVDGNAPKLIVSIWVFCEFN